MTQIHPTAKFLYLQSNLSNSVQSVVKTIPRLAIMSAIASATVEAPPYGATADASPPIK